jgi:translation initiation factor IF-3
MDYNRFKYDAAQKAKESRRKSTSTGIKEMKYRPKIGSGDFDTKTRQVIRFLGEGHKVKVTIMFRGREMSHPELGKKILDQVAEAVASVAKVEAAAKLDGRNMIMVLAPDRRAQVRKQTVDDDPAAAVQPEAPVGANGPIANGPVTNAPVTNAPAANGPVANGPVAEGPVPEAAVSVAAQEPAPAAG